MPLDELMTKEQVMERLGISLSTMDVLIRERRIDIIKMGRAVRITGAALDAYIQSCLRPAQPVGKE